MTIDLIALHAVIPAPAPLPNRRGQRSQVVTNMPADLPNLNAFASDRAVTEIVEANCGWYAPELCELGASVGSTAIQELARVANEQVPVLKTHDRFGRRIDRVEYHPAYHELMRLSYASKVHSLPWIDDRPGAQVMRAAVSYLWNQAENGIGCLNVMSYSIVPLLRHNPQLDPLWERGVLSTQYDPRHLPAGEKTGLTVAMSMTEKQGGSDLRANVTYAEPTGEPGEYVLRGHKFFCSAPMGDIVLLTARTTNGVSLFLVPRILPDGSHNGIYLQRLKDKLGNRSNASSEIEIDGALGYLLGGEGHGIAEFVKHMTHYIRMDFSVASAGIMRRALTLALQHVRNRTAFGHRIADLPQMRNVLADLAIECEAALHLGMRMVSALDRESRSEADALLLRIGVPVAKYWNCKRVNHVVLEALECHGGMGYIEEQPVARLLREAPLNSIWEGTGAMMGLDFARAVRREPDTVEALLEEIRAGASGDRQLKTLAVELADELLHAGDLFEADARRLMGKAALGLQASLLRRFAPATTADLFVSSRLEQPGALEFGTLRAHAARLQEVTDRALGDASS